MKQKKKEEKLARRQADHLTLKQRLVDQKTKSRYDSGGYRRPGAVK